MRPYSFTLLLLLAGLFVSTATFSQTIRQKSTTEGLSIGLQGHMLGWSSDYFQFLDENSGNGLGFGGRVGFGLTQRFEVFAQYDRTKMNIKNIDAESFTFTNLTGGVRFNFSATTHALRPFAEVGYVHRVGKVDQVINNNSYDNILFKGGAAHIGAGLNYYLSLPIALTANGSFQVGGKSAIDLNGERTSDKADVSTFRVSLGVILFLSEL
ncbi:outer membrane beta-barrel protein [Larkinella terrae]|uniref:Outer membrane beta-barrel protein n=1 Tax=Larkinella terrae TaxID=2025311 RepID=A0A7K0EIF5_9BACT|nr:outer membrane beta-barrel protein [Larkinella terrae]MRS61623.1 outer membrane beta-barrel protein [Larkinella terrae]